MKKIIFLISLFVFLFTATAQEINLLTLDGEEISYTKLVSKPKTVLFIWTTWCPSCRKEMKRLSNECISIRGIEIKFLNAGQSNSKVKRFVKSNKINGCISDKIVLDTQNILARLYNVSAIPNYIFLQDGKFIYKSYFFTEKLAKMVFQNN